MSALCACGTPFPDPCPRHGTSARERFLRDIEDGIEDLRRFVYDVRYRQAGWRDVDDAQTACRGIEDALDRLRDEMLGVTREGP